MKIGTASVPRVMPNLYYEVEVLSWQETTRHVAWVAWLEREKGKRGQATLEKKEKKGEKRKRGQIYFSDCKEM